MALLWAIFSLITIVSAIVVQDVTPVRTTAKELPEDFAYFFLNKPNYGRGRRESFQSALKHARELVNTTSVASLASIFSYSSEYSTHPIAQTEYYVDCGTGVPYFLLMSVSSTILNVQAGSKVSASIFNLDTVNTLYANHRVSLLGTLKEVGVSEVEDCFLTEHPVAAEWKPSTGVHKSKYYKLDIDNILYIGGFGNVSYIGSLPVEEYLHL